MRAVVLLLLLVACATTRRETEAPSATVQSIALPDASDGGVVTDYLAYDAAHHRVWVPAGNTGNVDVIDTATQAVTRISGFGTAEMERNGRKRVVGPSSVTLAGDVVYVGNRADSKICSIDAASLAVGACEKIDAMPDGIAWVGATREVWITTPRDQSIRILGGGRITLDGDPEGYAVDDARGLFFTNLEDKDRTLAIDVKTRRVVSTWEPGCGSEGPRGLALDRSANLLIVACTDHVAVLREGKVVSSLPTGAGVDNIDYVEARRELYVAAAGAAMLTVAKLEPASGALSVVAQQPIAKGARNAVATEQGVAYIASGSEGAVLVVRARQ
jgi:DNA-binding beta-propeller fold protein YncE